MHLLTKLALDRTSALWNAHIPKRAIRITVDEDSVRYLHPTKGWRRIAKDRVGL